MIARSEVARHDKEVATPTRLSPRGRTLRKHAAAAFRSKDGPAKTVRIQDDHACIGNAPVVGDVWARCKHVRQGALGSVLAIIDGRAVRVACVAHMQPRAPVGRHCACVVEVDAKSTAAEDRSDCRQRALGVFEDRRRLQQRCRNGAVLGRVRHRRDGG